MEVRLWELVEDCNSVFVVRVIDGELQLLWLGHLRVLEKDLLIESLPHP